MTHIDPASKAVVIDASVVLKWYVSEPDTSVATYWHKRIKARRTIGVIPDLLFLEVSNALLRRHKLPMAQVRMIVNDLETLGFELVPIGRFPVDQIVQLAVDHSLSTYDALYLQLAKVTNYPLLTADKQLLTAAPTLTRALR